MKHCPKCGAPLKTLTSNGITVEQCDSCGYTYNATTGEVKYIAMKGESCIVRCPSCASKNRFYREASGSDGYVGSRATCAFCNADFEIPEEPDPDLSLVITCMHCGGKSSVPANKGKLSITCPQCKSKLIHDTGTWPRSRAASQPAHSTPTTQKAQTSSYAAPNVGTRTEKPAASRPVRSTPATQNTQVNQQPKVSVNECYQCPKCGWTHPNTSALSENTAKHTRCQSCGNSYLVHLTWDD